MMPPNVEATEQVLLDVTQRLQALNRSQTSLASSMHSSRSLPAPGAAAKRPATHVCDMCCKESASSAHLQLHRGTHLMENMAVRRKSRKASRSPQVLQTEDGSARPQDTVEFSLGPVRKGRLESLLQSGRQRIKRSKASAPPAHISTFFAGRKTSQRSASSGDSGYESMDRPDPVATLLGMKGKEANNQRASSHARPAGRKDMELEKVVRSAVTCSAETSYFNRKRVDEISKLKKFSQQLERKVLLIKGPTGTEKEPGHTVAPTERRPGHGPVHSWEERPPEQAGTSHAGGIAVLASAMSSTDDILGELISPTSYRSRLQSCRQSGGSMSDGELSFMGVRAPSIRSFSIKENDAESIAEHLAHNIVKRCLHSRSQSTIRSRTASRQDSNQSTPPISARHTPATSVSSTSKRSRGKEDGSEDAEDGDTKRRDSESKKSRLDMQQEVKLFACPYSKYDPQRFSEVNVVEKEYRRCSCCYLRDIPRLKQHLYRVHRRPEYYCGSCFDSFKSRELLDAHTRQRPSCEVGSPRFEEKMTDDQLNSIKRRIVKGDPCELWFNIFKTLFPRAPRPLSPYASDNDPTSVDHFVTLFRWFGPEELFNLMRDRREQVGGLPSLETSTQAIVDEAFEIALPAYLQAQHDNRGFMIPELESGSVQQEAGGYVGVPGPRQLESLAQATGEVWQPGPPVVPIARQRHRTLIISHEEPVRPLQGPSIAQSAHSAAFTGYEWSDPPFDPTEVMQSFEAYGSVVAVAQPPPGQMAMETAADEFFDFSGYRS